MEKLWLIIFISKILMYVFHLPLYNIQDNMKFQKKLPNMFTYIVGIPEVFAYFPLVRILH